MDANSSDLNFVEDVVGYERDGDATDSIRRFLTLPTVTARVTQKFRDPIMDFTKSIMLTSDEYVNATAEGGARNILGTCAVAKDCSSGRSSKGKSTTCPGACGGTHPERGRKGTKSRGPPGGTTQEGVSNSRKSRGATSTTTRCTTFLVR